MFDDNQFKKSFITILVVSIIVSGVSGGAMGFWAGAYSSGGFNFFNLFKSAVSGQGSTSKLAQELNNEKVVTVDEQSAVVSAVQKVSPAVVSIIVTKDLPVIEKYYSNPPAGSNDFFQQFFGGNMGDFFNQGVPQYKQDGTQKQEVGGGTGFIITPDGYIVTNKHVVADTSADYTVLMNDGKKLPAKVLARDPMADLAILKIDSKNLPTVELGNSSNLKAGQSVIAIGNALGEFRNTVSTGVISGLSRSVTAGGDGLGTEALSGVIQTDASINPGNSGGPLLNIAGQVIGINTAMAQGAQNIGFAIPINDVKNTITSVEKNGRIIRPWLGVRYAQIDKSIQEANHLSVDYGALIVRGQNQTDLAVIPGSPADKAGLVENDIILEINGKKINSDYTLSQAVNQSKVGDTITLKVLHRGKTEDVKVKLEEMKNNS